MMEPRWRRRCGRCGSGADRRRRHERVGVGLGDRPGALAAGQIGADRARGAAAGAHRQDHGGAAGDDVAAGEHARHAGGLGGRVGDDVAPLVELQPRRRLGDDRVGLGAQRVDHGVALELEELVLRDRLAAALLVGLAEHHLLHLHAAHVAVGVGQDLDRPVQEEELDAFLLGVAQLLDARRRLGLGAAVDAAHGRRAQPLGHAQAVHRGVAGADHDHALAQRDRRVEVRELVAAHQVDAGQELVGRIDLAGEFARDAEEGRRAGAGADEHRVVAHLAHQLQHREGLADDLVGLELDAHGLERRRPRG